MRECRAKLFASPLRIYVPWLLGGVEIRAPIQVRLSVAERVREIFGGTRRQVDLATHGLRRC